ncbi:MAG: ABC transporter ATP-binding protein/permease [Lachnospiraceae bacterium]|nr:ABC transporter ATP-binding protein/permease [Lachnospiraceae bacterium]
MRSLLIYLRNYRKETILAPLFKLLEVVFELIVPLVMAHLIDAGIGGHDEKTILAMGGLLALLAFVGLVSAITAQFFAARAAVGFAAEVRMALFEKIERFSFTQLDTIGTRTLTTRLTSDVNQAQNGVNMVLRLILRSPFVVVGATIMAFTVDARAALIFVAVIPVLSLIVFLIMRRTQPLYKAAQGKLDEVLLHTRENLVGARVIRAFNRQEAERAEFDAAADDYTQTQQVTGAVSGLLNPLTQVVVNAGILILILAGAFRVESGNLTQGQMVALLNYMSQILIELVKFANLIVTISRASASGDRIATVLSVETEEEMEDVVRDRDADVIDASSDAAVVFDHVSLRYAGAGAEALHDITFTAQRGETIGIIGGTGSGKSSLVHLIPRFYDATEGSVRVFGEDVKDLRRDGLRRRIGMVFQKAELFSGTIRGNLRFGMREAVSGNESGAADGIREETLIRQALEASQSAEFVDAKPGGVEFVLTQGARNLSGGQKQRLSIARALMRRPDILILDDAASALDFATDLKLRTAIRKMSGQMTIFIVSQRVPSVRFADRILVLDRGRLVAQGKHEELLESCDIYREIYYSQFPEGMEADPSEEAS